MNIKILLLQARDPDDPIRAEERLSFATKAGLEPDQVIPHDLLGGPPPISEARNFDALMIGGSGDYYVSKGDLPEIRSTLDFLGEVVETGHPTFASCFGFQLLTEALGGSIEFAPEETEVGTYAVTLTEAGKEDPLLGSLPETFNAQLGRKDRARTLPKDAVHLASTALARYQAFRIGEKPIWCTQFHPELGKEENLRRYERYLTGYAGHMTEAQQQEALDRFQESPEADALIPRFLKLVFG